MDSSGMIYFTGGSDSDGYPTRNALQFTRKGSHDIILSQLDPSLSGDASLLYSTYLGTSAVDEGFAIAVDLDGNVYLTGRTQSSKFPLRNPLQYQSHAGTTCNTTCLKRL